MNRLSHTQASTFQECGKKFEYRYIYKLYPEETGGALIFGSAIDKALESLLKGEDYKSKFIEVLTEQEVNKVLTYIPTSDKIAYGNSDFDIDLIQDENIKYVLTELFKIDEIIEHKSIVGLASLSKEDTVKLNLANWYSLRAKGLLMLEEFKENILPNIKKTLDTQIKVELANSKGDSIIGYADAVLMWKDIEKPIIVDFKTSSIEYEEDSVLLSPQLTLYVHDLSEKYDNTRYAAFIVLNKKIKKEKEKICKSCGKNGTGQRHQTCDNIINNERCGGKWKETLKLKTSHQVIINEIPEQTENIVLENYDMINQMIDNKVFHRNFSACKKKYGSTTIKCPYFDKCYHNSDKGLKKND